MQFLGAPKSFHWYGGSDKFADEQSFVPFPTLAGACLSILILPSLT